MPVEVDDGLRDAIWAGPGAGLETGNRLDVLGVVASEQALHAAARLAE